MNCADLEIVLCDYMDGTLAAGERAEVERHIAGCAACAALARDVSAAVDFIGRAETVEPPPELMTRTVFELQSALHTRAPHVPGGVRRFLQGWLQPVLQPRFAMGFAMTILSFSLLAKYAGISPRQPSIDDLRPAKILQSVDDWAYRSYQRTVKYYENLRFVYEIQTQLHEWRQKEQELKGRASTNNDAASGRTAGSDLQTPGGTENRTKDKELRNKK